MNILSYEVSTRRGHGHTGNGWEGAHQRATTDTGLQLMGARLYNPATGRFTTTDPVPGGNTNTYTYPNDPTNTTDLDGRRRTSDVSGFGENCYPNCGRIHRESIVHAVRRAVKRAYRGARHNSYAQYLADTALEAATVAGIVYGARATRGGGISTKQVVSGTGAIGATSRLRGMDRRRVRAGRRKDRANRRLAARAVSRTIEYYASIYALARRYG